MHIEVGINLCTWWHLNVRKLTRIVWEFFCKDGIEREMRLTNYFVQDNDKEGDQN